MEEFRKMAHGPGFIFGLRSGENPLRLEVTEINNSGILGYNDTALRAEGFCASKVHPDDLSSLYLNLKTALSKRLDFGLQYRMLKADGSYSTVVEKGNFHEDSFLCFITELPASGENSSDFFKSIFDSISEAVLIHKDFSVIDVNRAFCEMFGWSKHDVIGKNAWEAMPVPKKDPGIDRIVEMLKADDSIAYDSILWHYRKDGSRICVALKADSISLGGTDYRCIKFRDITKDVEARQKLLDSNEKYLNLINGSREGIVIHDKGIAIEASPRFCEIVGRTEAEIIGKPVISLVSPEEAPKILHFLRENQQNFDNVRNEKTKALHSSGRVLDIEIWGNKIELAGELYRYVVIRDITEEKSVQRSLETSHKRYKLLSDITEEMVVVHDNGIIVEVNRAACDFFGMKEEELIGKHTYDVMTPESIKEYGITKEFIENEYKSDRVNEGSFMKIQGESVIHCHYKESMLYVDGKRLRYVVMRDVTEQTISQQHLEQSQKRYKMLSDITDEMVLVHDKGIIVEANRAMCEHYDMTEEQLIGMHTFDLLPKDTIAAYGLSKEKLEAEYISDRISDGINIKQKGDRLIYCQYRESIFYSEGKRLRYVVMRDISKLQETQMQLEKSNEKYKRLAGITDEMVIVHEGGIILEINQAACQFFEKTEEALIGVHLFDLVSEKTKKEYNLTKADLDILFNSDRLSEGIRKIERKGKVFHLEYREKVFNDNGRMLRYLILRDISQLRESQLKLEESRNKFKLFADATHEAISIYKNGTLREANKTFCELFQLSSEEVNGYKSIEIVLPADRPLFLELGIQMDMIITALEDQKIPQHELKAAVHKKMFESGLHEVSSFPYTPDSNGCLTLPLRKKDGTVFMAEYYDDFILVDGEIYQYQIIRDVTKSFEAQRKLEESNRKYKFFADATREGIIIHREGEILEVNEAACRLFDKSEGELIGLGIQDLTDNYGTVEKLNAVNIGSTKLDRILFNKSDGETFIAELWESSIQLDGENLRYTVIRDMTERIRYEQRIEELVYNLSERNKQLNCLLDVSRVSSNRSGTFEDLIDSALEIIPQGWQYQDICGVCIHFGHKEKCNKKYQESYHSMIAPIQVGNEDAGFIRVFYTEACPPADEGPFLFAERTLIDALGFQLGMIIEKKLSDDRILASVLETEDRERARMAKELHDSLGQILMAVSLNLESVKKEIDQLSSKSQHKLSNAVHYLGQAIQESRELAHSLMPKAIGDYGYVLAVHSLMERLGAEEVDIQFYNNLEEKRLPAKMELALFRITQEALTNILKHADASTVTIQLMKYSDMIILTIEDNGNGFEYSDEQRYFGIGSMRNRTHALSGIFTVESKPGHGTTIMIELPL